MTRPRRPSDEEIAKLREEFRIKAKQQFGIDLPTEEEVAEAKANKQIWQGMTIGDVGLMFSDEFIIASHLMRFMGNGYQMAGDAYNAKGAAAGFNILRRVSMDPYLERPYREYLTRVDELGHSIGAPCNFVENASEKDLNRLTGEIAEDEEDEEALDRVLSEVGTSGIEDLLGKVVAMAGADVPEPHTQKPMPPVIPFGRKMKPQA